MNDFSDLFGDYVRILQIIIKILKMITGVLKV